MTEDGAVVALIDDYYVNVAKLLTEALQAHHCSLRCYESPDNFWKDGSRDLADVILLDDDFRGTRRADKVLRKLISIGSLVPVVILTKYNEDWRHDQLRDLGALRFFNKSGVLNGARVNEEFLRVVSKMAHTHATSRHNSAATRTSSSDTPDGPDARSNKIPSTVGGTVPSECRPASAVYAKEFPTHEEIARHDLSRLKKAIASAGGWRAFRKSYKTPVLLECFSRLLREWSKDPAIRPSGRKLGELLLRTDEIEVFQNGFVSRMSIRNDSILAIRAQAAGFEGSEGS